MDGAGAWRRFRTVTWPALSRSSLAITALNFIWNFNSFGLVYVLTSGGPGGRTRLPMLFAYEEAFRYGQFGYAAAMGCVMVAVIVRPPRRLSRRPAQGRRRAHEASPHQPAPPRAPAQYARARWATWSSCLPAALAGLHRLQAAAGARLACTPPGSPRHPTLDNFRHAFDEQPLLQAAALNSLLVAGRRRADLRRHRDARCLCDGPVTAPAHRAATGWIAGQPGVPLRADDHPAVPGSQNLHLINSLCGLIIVYVVWSLPFALWMLLGYVRAVPRELEEAAAVDGAGRLRTLRLVTARCWPRAWSPPRSSPSSPPGTSSSSRSSCSSPRRSRPCRSS